MNLHIGQHFETKAYYHSKQSSRVNCARLKVCDELMHLTFILKIDWSTLIKATFPGENEIRTPDLPDQGQSKLSLSTFEMILHKYQKLSKSSEARAANTCYMYSILLVTGVRIDHILFSKFLKYLRPS